MNEYLKSNEVLSQKPQDSDPQDYIKDGLLHCHRCHTPKEVMLSLIPTKRKVVCNCACEQQVWEDQKNERKRREWQNYCENLRTRGIQDATLRDCCFEQSDGSNPANIKIAQNYVAAFSENFYPKGSGLLLWGDVGTGKSYVAACIANALISQGIPALMTSETKINNEFYSEKDKNKYIDALNYYHLLIIDDLGVEHKSGFAMENMFTVIDERYKSNKPLIITTNLTLEEMENPTQMDHKRIYDRILEKCTPLVFDGSNKRHEKRILNFQSAREQLLH